ncbi:MAG: aminopeptidase P N-terminal domain-containing protein, partial [Dehalococcoidia bacterium]
MTGNFKTLASSHFAERRARLMQSLGNGAIILTAGHDQMRNNDVDHEFRQQSSFWYLTGFDEPDAVAVLRPGSDQPYALFVRPFDARFEIWVGFRVGVEGAQERLGADVAFSIEQLEEELPKLLAEVETVHYSLGSDEKVDKLVNDLVAQRRAGAQRGGTPLLSIMEPRPVIDRMRLIKSAEEIELMQQAIDISAQGFEAAMRSTAPGVYEYQVQTDMEAQFRRLGSPRNGYPSIVASGANACILHYIKNRAQMQEGDLLLIDAGAEWEFYTADVTRTWPVSGRFTPEQRAVYDIVLEAQRQAIAAVAPGTGMDQAHQVALKVLVQGLVDLGVLEGEVDSLIEDKVYSPYYMHGTSHWLGLDVHDAGQYRSGETPTELQEGMVFTVEPGLYFGTQAPDSPEHLKGIGIRIEDDVLVTADGCRVLTAAIPKQVSEM